MLVFVPWRKKEACERLELLSDIDLTFPECKDIFCRGSSEQKHTLQNGETEFDDKPSPIEMKSHSQAGNQKSEAKTTGNLDKPGTGCHALKKLSL